MLIKHAVAIGVPIRVTHIEEPPALPADRERVSSHPPLRVHALLDIRKEAHDVLRPRAVAMEVVVGNSGWIRSKFHWSTGVIARRVRKLLGYRCEEGLGGDVGSCCKLG